MSAEYVAISAGTRRLMAEQDRENRRRPGRNDEPYDPSQLLIDPGKPLIDARKSETHGLSEVGEPAVELFIGALKARETYFHLLFRHAKSITTMEASPRPAMASRSIA